jgi:hypothetical protein
MGRLPHPSGDRESIGRGAMVAALEVNPGNEHVAGDTPQRSDVAISER